MPLQDSDNFIIGRGTDSYKITYENLKDDLNYVPPPPPIVVGKGVITPSEDVETGDTLTGSATVEDAVNPVETHVWELDGVEDQRGSSATYTAKEGEVRYRKEVTDDNNDTPTIGEWSDPVTVTTPPEPPGPTATMSGLRFDSARKTYLQNGNKAPAVFTFSCWSKLTSSSNTKILLGAQGSAYINIVGDVYSYNGSAFSGSPKAALNRWQHVCVVFTGEGATLYLDGAVAGTSNSTTRFDGIKIGSNGSGTQVNNGYLSDVYFVDSKIAPPTTFGKYFEGGKWGPLDSSVIQSNLDNLQPADPTPEPGPGAAGQPYDSRANTDQVWSNGSTVVSNPQFAFDGNTTTRAIPADPGDLIYPHTESFTFSSIDVTQSLELWVGTGNNSTNGGLVINGTDASDQIGSKDSTGSWVTINGFDSLSSIGLTRTNDTTYTSLFAVRVDGRLLVDQGVWDNSQNWSDNASNSDSTYPVTQLFDGVFGGAGATNAVDLKLGTITFNPPLSYTSSFGVYANGGTMDININGAGNESIGNPPNDGTLVPVKTGSGTISSIAGSASSSAAWLYGLNIDGKKLVDAGAQWNTSQVWSQYGSGGQTGAAGWEYTFNGDLTTGTGIYFKDNTGTYDFPAGYSGTLKIHMLSSSATAGGMTVNVKGVEKTVSFTGTWQREVLDFGNVTADIGTISFAPTGIGAQIEGIELGGKRLVDGTAVWDTSQVWSNNLTGFVGVTPAANAFDGNTSLSCESPANSTLTYTGPINGNLKLYRANGSANDDGNLVNVGSGNVNFPRNKWVDFGNVNISSFTVTDNGTSSSASLSGVMVDGAILVDGAIPWNSSQVWSDGTESGTPSTPWTEAFNGALGDGVGTEESGEAKLTFTNSVPFTKLRIYAQKNPTAGALAVLVNETSITGLGTSMGWLDVTDQVTSPLESIAVEGNGGSNSTFFGAVEVDGELLVDPGFGGNGFYLPFDPAQTGANYSSGLTTNGTWNPGFNAENAFNGNTSTGSRAETSDGTVVTLDLSSNPVAIGSSLKVMTGSNGAAGGTMTLNGNANTAVSITNSYTEYTVPLDSETELSTLTFNADSGSFVVYVKVDDSVLVDHSSIGVDMSGNKNNFHDQNFGVGDSSQVWSKGTITGNDYSASYSKDRAFNGSFASYFAVVANEAFTVDLSNKGLTGEVKVYAGIGATTQTLSLNGGVAVAATGSWVTLGTVADPSAFVITSSATSGESASLAAIEVAGTVLIDPSAVDTVLDTPMKNYAVLDSNNKHIAGDIIRNGNLELLADGGSAGFGQSTIDFSSGQFYCEVVFNEGSSQIKPVFGIRESSSTGYDNSYYYYGIDGQAYTDSVPVNYGATYGPGDVIGMSVNMDVGVVAFYKNGVSQGEAFTGVSGSYRVVAGKSGGNHGGFNINYGQQPFVHTPPAGFEGLYQEWIEYARSALGYAEDRIAQLEKRNLFLEGLIANAQERLAALELNEISDDAVDTALITLIGNINDRLTALEGN